MSLLYSDSWYVHYNHFQSTVELDGSVQTGSSTMVLMGDSQVCPRKTDFQFKTCIKKSFFSSKLREDRTWEFHAPVHHPTLLSWGHKCMCCPPASLVGPSLLSSSVFVQPCSASLSTSAPLGWWNRKWVTTSALSYYWACVVWLVLNELM